MPKRFIVGIDVGGTNLKIGLFDAKYNLKSKEILSTNKFLNKGALITATVNSINKIIARNNIRKSEILGIGLGVPGPTDEESGIVHFLPNIPGWREVNLKRILKRRLKLPVAVDNDAKLMCLAEFVRGSAKGFKNVLCLTLGTGVGGSLIINGKLFRGANNASGEIGHIPINEFGPKCNCGKFACLEAYIGNNKIIEEARKNFKRPISLEELGILARKRNRRALEIWVSVGRHLGVALSGIVNLLNLDAVVIGGGVSNAGQMLFSAVRKTISERAMSIQAQHVKILKAKLGSDAGLIGAAILVKEGETQ